MFINKNNRLVVDFPNVNYHRNVDSFLLSDNEVYLLMAKSSQETSNNNLTTKKLLEGKLIDIESLYIFQTSFKYKKMNKKTLENFLSIYSNVNYSVDSVMSQIYQNTINISYKENFMNEKDLQISFEAQEKKVRALFNFICLSEKICLLEKQKHIINKI